MNIFFHFHPNWNKIGIISSTLVKTGRKLESSSILEDFSSTFEKMEIVHSTSDQSVGWFIDVEEESLFLEVGHSFHRYACAFFSAVFSSRVTSKTNMSSLDMPVLALTVDVPNQLAIMDAGSPRRRRLNRKVRKRPSANLEFDGECKDGEEDGCDGEDDGEQQRVMKRPRATPLAGEDGDEENHEDEEEEKCDDDDDDDDGGEDDDSEKAFRKKKTFCSAS